MAKNFDIPSLSSKVDPEVRRAFNAIKARVEALGEVISNEELTGTEAFVRKSNGALIAHIGEPALTTELNERIDQIDVLWGDVTVVREPDGLAAAVAEAGDTPRTVKYTVNQTLTADFSCPANIVLVPMNESVINYGAHGFTYLGSTAQWPMSQVLNGTGVVTFPAGSTVRPQWFGAKGDDTTDDSAAVVRTIAAVSTSGGTLDGDGRTYLLNTAGATVNADNVFVRDITFKRTSTLNGYLVRYANTANTEGGGLENVKFIGNPTNATGNAALMMGSATYKANRYLLRNVSADSFAQYGVGIEAGDGWQIDNIRVTNHGLTVGTIASCIGFYVYPKHTETSRGGQLANVYAEISAASQANADANHAAVKLQTHSDLVAANITAIGGFEESVSIDSISGRVINLNVTPQAGNRPGLAVGNQNKSHTESGKPFHIDGVTINGTGTNSLTISGLPAVTVSAVDTSADTLTSAAHGYPVNTPVSYTTDGTQIGGMAKEALYYVINPTTNTFQLAATRGGTAIDLTSAGSGTHRIQSVRLTNCTIRNVKGERAAFLNNAAFKNCEFSNWEFTSIAFDAGIAGTIAAEVANTGNTIRNVKTRPNAVGNRCVMRASNSVIEDYGNMGNDSIDIGSVSVINGTGNRVSGLAGRHISAYSDLASLSDGAGGNATVYITSGGGVAVGDLVIPAVSTPVQGCLVTGHVNAETSATVRVQNETGDTLDLDRARYMLRKVQSSELARYTTQSVQFSAVNLADGAGVAVTVPVPGAVMGGVAVMAWEAPLGSAMPFAYVSVDGTVTCRVQNESGGVFSGVTATADLNVGILRNDAADYRNAVVYHPASLADGEGVTVTIPVPGASVGDFAVASFSNDLQGVMLTAEVSADGTVSVRLQNETGAPVDLLSGTLKALVFTAR